MKRISNEVLQNIITESIQRVLNEKKVLKLPKKEEPMSQPNEMANGDPNAMGGDPSMIGADPMAGDNPSMSGGGDPMAGGDPNAMGGDPMAGSEEAPMSSDNPAGGDMNGTNPKVDYIKQMLDQLNDADLEAAEGYIESLTKDNGGSSNGEQGADNLPESFIFTKGQLKRINEGLGVNNLVDDKEKNKVEKRNDTKIKNSPFSSPRFK